ncbi:hypothetical protein BKA64DRAFT_91682 [Cadophora sp. MPI-SDFR-AT-0126]|nr:hypothetical protein BKA64DRAFT_91682 [Leotiomycetes sp. MPI-SDFR-AT-0126]
MAEVFGVIGGGLSVFSLAIQLASSIKILKDFLDIIEETPTEVCVALEELDILSLVLQDIEQSINDQMYTIPTIRPAVEKSIRLCKTGCVSLNCIAEEISGLLASKRKWTSFKVGLKRDKLARLKVHLESTKTLLTLANQCYYNSAVQRYEWETQHRAMDELKITISGIFPNEFVRDTQKQEQSDSRSDLTLISWEGDLKKVDSQKSLTFNTTTRSEVAFTGSSKSLIKYLIGSLELSSGPKTRPSGESARDKPRSSSAPAERYISIQLPSWLLSRRYQIRSRKAYSGWDHRFRTYYPTSSNDEIFGLCTKGDVDGLQQLFQAGAASPFSTDYDGFTTLHYAISRGQIETAKFLLQCGVDVNAKSGPGNFASVILNKDYNGTCTALQMFSWLGAHLVSQKTISEAVHLEILRLLLERGEGGLASVDGGGHNALQLYLGPVSTYSWLLEQGKSEVCPDEFAEPLWRQKFDTWFMDPVALLREGLPNRQITEEVAMQRCGRGFTILHYAVQRWSHISTRGSFLFNDRELGTKDHLEFEAWEQLVKDILRAGADIHALSACGKTPFLVLLSNSFRVHWPHNSRHPPHRTRRSLKKILAAWLRILEGEGVDLQAYEEREVQLWNTRLLKLWGGISSVEFMPRNWVEIYWDTPETCYEELSEFALSCDYYSLLTGDKGGEVLPPEDGSDWHMVGGKYIRAEIVDEDANPPQIPGSWV